MDKLALTHYTNELFKLFINDLKQAKNITTYRICKDTGLSRQFFTNKFNGWSKNSYVSLPTIYLIANTYNFTFDLLKYDKQYKQQLKDIKKPAKLITGFK